MEISSLSNRANGFSREDTFCNTKSDRASSCMEMMLPNSFVDVFGPELRNRPGAFCLRVAVAEEAVAVAEEAMAVTVAEVEVEVFYFYFCYNFK